MTDDESEVLRKLRAMRPSKRFSAFRKLPEDTKLAITEPCPGEAHRNPYIDNCVVCLHTTWGRTLRHDETEDLRCPNCKAWLLSPNRNEDQSKHKCST